MVAADKILHGILSDIKRSPSGTMLHKLPGVYQLLDRSLNRTFGRGGAKLQ